MIHSELHIRALVPVYTHTSGTTLRSNHEWQTMRAETHITGSTQEHKPPWPSQAWRELMSVPQGTVKQGHVMRGWVYTVILKAMHIKEQLKNNDCHNHCHKTKWLLSSTNYPRRDNTHSLRTLLKLHKATQVIGARTSFKHWRGWARLGTRGACEPRRHTHRRHQQCTIPRGHRVCTEWDYWRYKMYVYVHVCTHVSIVVKVCYYGNSHNDCQLSCKWS